MSEEPLNAMEGRARRRASPAGMRTRPIRVEPEPPPPTKRHEVGTTTRVAVVYYLCRNHQLEHPHFMEVPLASPQGLYLQDVLSRLDALRGKGMAAKYSWSCKRRYRHGFVWHDLSDGDLLLPAQGTEYVLKGSELQLDQPTPDHQQNSGTKVQLAGPSQHQESPCSPAAAAAAVSAIKEAVPVPPSPPAVVVVSAIKEAAPEPASLSSPSASTIGYDERCRMPGSGSSSDSSPKTSTSSSGASSPGLNNPTTAHDADTQTDDKERGASSKPQQGQVAAVGVTPGRPGIVDESPHSMRRPAGEHPSSRRSGTLQSLIRAEAAGWRRGLLEDDDGRTATTTGSGSGRLKPANLLMCLMSCGCGPNNPGFGLVQASSYKPRFARLECPYSSPELFPLGALKPGASSVPTVRASGTENPTGILHDGELKQSSSSSRCHEDGVSEEAHSPEGDPVNLCIGSSRRMSGPSSGKVSLFEGGAVPR